MNLFPVDNIIPSLIRELTENSIVVLSADPGAGKTTRVPVGLLNADWLDRKKIIMLEPRRLAAVRSAQFMAFKLGEKVGETIGYRIRGDTKISSKTRIEVVTEGILTRMLQNDPEIQGAGIIIFDEFHERSINADLGLALALDVQKFLRKDLRILIMSATLDGLGISQAIDKVKILKCEGRTYPVKIIYLSHTYNISIEKIVVSAIIRALETQEGDLLVFLPGVGEIGKVKSILEKSKLQENVIINILYGDASPHQQQAALSAVSADKRKVILSTNLAETSLTIDGVRIVVDSGLVRISKFDHGRGMSGLVTTQVSVASADQRCGRAGRQAPGICFRLWREDHHKTLAKFSTPEILTTDLAPLALDLARWGNPSGENMIFIDNPPQAHLNQARVLLEQLGAIGESGKITSHGREMSELGVHPRLAHMLIRGKELGIGALACDLAALLEESTVLRQFKSNDLNSILNEVFTSDLKDKQGRQKVIAQAGRLRELLGVKAVKDDVEKTGLLLALAYPERIGKYIDGKYKMAGGPVASIQKGNSFSEEKYLAIGDVDGLGSEVKIFLAALVSENDLRRVFSDQFTDEIEVKWSEVEGCVISRRIEKFGEIILSEQPYKADEKLIIPAMIKGIQQIGLKSLPWTKDSESLRTRSEWYKKQLNSDVDWPDLNEKEISTSMNEWLSPYLTGITRISQLKNLDMSAVIRGMFTFKQLSELEKMAPTHIVVPTGSRIRIDYGGEIPVLAVRMQEMFGETETPVICRGKVKILLHLLSPAHRPLAITQDLPSFWKNAYPEVRKDMRGRYPKHYWPENPLEAEPTKRRKPK